MIKIMIVEDMQMLRESLKYMIESDKELEVVALAENGENAVAKCIKYNPDVVIMDLKMPCMDGFEATRAIKDKFPNKRVIALSTFNNEEYVKKAVESGVDGFITKDLGLLELTQSIKSVHLGLRVFQDISQNSGKRKSYGINENELEKFDLTDREIKIIKYIADGKSYKEIGEMIFISEGTVRNAVYNLLGRLNLNDRIQLAVFAAKNNII